jgi:DNA-binding transcriptional regulator YhcF (GntR family)
VEKISETGSISHSTSMSREKGESISSRDLKDVSLLSEEISKDLQPDPPTKTTGESQLIQDFHNNDNKILSLLHQHTGSYFSFKGLMRKLNLHQQSLTRALNRLEELGLIQRSVNGYKLNKCDQKSAISLPDKRKRSEYMQLLQTYIPKGIQKEEIMQALNGRWFNRIRWIGLMESEFGYMLQWINEDNTFQINVRMISDHIIIETNAISDEDKIEAMVGSCKIFEQITKLFQTRLQDPQSKALNSLHLLA